MTMTITGRTTRYYPGPGFNEDLDIRFWTSTRPYDKGDGRIEARIHGTVPIYCGAGNRHELHIDARETAWRTWGTSSELVAARDGDHAAAESVTDWMVAWAIDDAWDGCDCEREPTGGYSDFTGAAQG